MEETICFPMANASLNDRMRFLLTCRRKIGSAKLFALVLCLARKLAAQRGGRWREAEVWEREGKTWR